MSWEEDKQTALRRISHEFIQRRTSGYLGWPEVGRFPRLLPTVSQSNRSCSVNLHLHACSPVIFPAAPFPRGPVRTDLYKQNGDLHRRPRRIQPRRRLAGASFHDSRQRLCEMGSSTSPNYLSEQSLTEPRHTFSCRAEAPEWVALRPRAADGRRVVYLLHI